MKNVWITLIVILLTFGLCACGSNNSDDSNNEESSKIVKAKDNLNGFWTDENLTTMSIDGETGYLVWGGTPYPCVVNKAEKNITVARYSWDDSDSVYSYEFVNGKLTMNTENEQSLNDTIVFVSDKEASLVKGKNTLDGDWTDLNITSISIDGTAGFLTWGGTDYTCTVDSQESILNVKAYSWDDSDVNYSYKFVNGRLRMDTSNEQALNRTLVFIPSEEADKIEKKESQEEAAAEEEKERKKSSAKPSIEGANELSDNYYIVGEDIEPGIYDFGPIADEDGEPYFSIDVYDSKEYYEQGEGDAEGTDYLDHYKSYYGEEVKKGVSLKKGNVLNVEYPGVLYKKQ